MSVRTHSKLTVALGAVALLGLAVGACGKKDNQPAKPAAGAKGAPTAKAGEAAAPAKGEAQPNKDEAKKAEPGAKAAPEAKAAAAATPAPAANPAPSAAPTAAPALGGGDVIAVAGIPSYKNLMDTAIKVAAKVAPGTLTPQMASQGLEMVKGALGLTDISWLKTDAPIRAAVLDPKKYNGAGQLLILPITDKAKVLAALPATAKKGADAQGHAALLEMQGDKAYVDFIDGYAVVTENPKVFGDAQGFLAKGLQSFVPKGALELFADMKVVNRLYANDLKQGKEMLKNLYGQMLQGQMMPGAQQAVALELDMIFALVDSTDAVGMRLDATDSDLGWSFTVTPKAGTGLAKLVGKVNGQGSTLTAAAPKETWLGMTTNLDMRDMESLKALQKTAVEVYVEMLKLDAAGKAELQGLMDNLWKQATGDATFAFTVEGNNPAAMRYVGKVQSAETARELYAKLFDFAVAKALAVAKAEASKGGGAVPPELAKLNSFADVMALVQPMAAQMGVQISTSKGKKHGVLVDALTIDVDWTKTPIQQEEPETAKLLAKLLGNKIEFALGYAGDKLAMSFGAHARDDVVALASGTFPGGEPTLTAASKGSTMAMTVRVAPLLNALAAVVPEMASMAPTFSALPADEAFSFTVKGDGKQAVARLGLPLDLMAKLAALAR